MKRTSGLTLRFGSPYNLQLKSIVPIMTSFLKTSARAVIALAFALSLCLAARAQQRPLLTEDVDIIPPGTLRIQGGLDFMQDGKYPASGLTGDLTRVAVIGVNIGLSPNVEFQIQGVANNFLSINTRGPSAFPLTVAPGA